MWAISNSWNASVRGSRSLVLTHKRKRQQPYQVSPSSYVRVEIQLTVFNVHSLYGEYLDIHAHKGHGRRDDQTYRQSRGRKRPQVVGVIVIGHVAWRGRMRRALEQYGLESFVLHVGGCPTSGVARYAASHAAALEDSLRL
jgi:hypothetical protein